jgi:hypothetical protein
MTIWHMYIACRIPKATNTHSEYVIRIAFPSHQWLHEDVSVLRCTYFACLVFVVCCVGSGLCDGLITRPEESYRVRVCVCVCVLQTSTLRRPGPESGCWATKKIEVTESCCHLQHDVNTTPGLNTYLRLQTHTQIVYYSLIFHCNSCTVACLVLSACLFILPISKFQI